MFCKIQKSENLKFKIRKNTNRSLLIDMTQEDVNKANGLDTRWLIFRLVTGRCHPLFTWRDGQ
jgi:hypothetical protein